MTTIYFDEIKRKYTTHGLCKMCNKKRTRTITAEETVNPFNKNEDGTIKNRYEVIISVNNTLKNRVERFNAEGFICRSCKEYLGY